MRPPHYKHNSLNIITGLLSILLICLNSCGQQRTPEVSGLEGKPLPSFNVLLMDKTTTYEMSNITSGSPIVLFLFSPNCHFCNKQTEEITSNINSFGNIRFYFISQFPIAQIEPFYKNWNLKQYSNIIVGQDIDAFLSSYFNVKGVPFIAIYDANKRLKQVITGKVGNEFIKNVVLE